GLGGDVRTYAPLISYIQFIPVKNRGREQQPHTFGFRLLAGHVSSFATTAKVRNANSLAFVNGVPIYERFFLGDEFTIRGYNVRSISPISPLDTYITSRNVVLASNSTGTPTAIPGLPASLAGAGTFTGSSGANVLRLSRQFTSVGGDTQLLGNFEYRIPIFGPVSAALFADVGSSFNLHQGNIQTINTEFLADQPFLAGSSTSLSILTAQANPGLALSPLGGLVVRDNRFVSTSEFNNAIRVGPIDPSTGLPFGFQQVFLRGDVQTNTLIRLNESLFSRLGGNIRSSLGAEVRFQVPIINVPFRIIYAYNPNARRDQFIDGVPFFFDERKSVFRFSVGRTF
ncbi:MAG TPA: BamA/TamA family outer membrane protein, partial [Pyrinomonadaceae bacterium]|nr:BamA/TamA family outer membrane protein [Pyrinomonadaceae bacterium]